jgi:PhoH-like ATPase
MKLYNLSKNPILVSKDICLRTKARSQHIMVEDYKKDKVDSSGQYTGLCAESLLVESDVIDSIYITKFIETNRIYFPNEAVILQDINNPKNKAITIYKDNNLYLINNQIKAFGLNPLNLEQTIALNHLLDPEIKLVTLSGRAGSGKTLLAVAAALEMTLEQDYYSKFTVARPIMPFQQDIGFLPGDVDEKLGPWLMPIVDNLDFLFNFAEQPKNKKAGKVSAFEELKEKGVMDICPLTYIRGRSIPKQYIIIDESQQITAAELRTILTRVGKDTKIVLTGDYSQIDNPYLSADTNGLVYCVDKFKDQSISAHVTFSKCERSELATIADEIL